MMSMVPEVQKILKDNFSERDNLIAKKLARIEDLKRRGVISESFPKTFGTVKIPVHYEGNKHINFRLTDR